MKRIEFEATISGQGTEIRRIPDVGAIRFEDGEFEGISLLEYVEVVNIYRIGSFTDDTCIVVERSNGTTYKITVRKKENAQC